MPGASVFVDILQLFQAHSELESYKNALLISSCLSVCPSERSHIITRKTAEHVSPISYRGVLQTFVDTFQFWFRSGNTGYLYVKILARFSALN
jgi:hypothetical protein